MLYKNLPFTTEWIEFADIPSKLKEVGAEPTGERVDGSPLYTVPTIKDSSTGEIVSDSLQIAEYLNKTYPEAPPLIPHGARGPIHVFNDDFVTSAIMPMITWLAYDTSKLFDERSAESFRLRREEDFKVKFEQLAPGGAEEKQKMLAAAKAGWSAVAGMYEGMGDTEYYLGDQASYADIVVVAYLLYIRTVFGSESDEWKEMMAWDGGRWAKLLKFATKYDF